MTLLHKNRRGFTLVELLIVITIIGILAVALIPTVTGVQSRARDVSRVQGVRGLVAAFEAFASDRGTYPASLANSGCLSSTTGAVSGADATAFAVSLSNGKTPVDPQATNIMPSCGTQGVYGYKALVNSQGGVNGGYMLLANVETYQKANTSSGQTLSTLSGATAVNAMLVSSLTSAPADGRDSLFVSLEGA